MKNTKLKLFPVMLMLIAGSITSIMTYHFQYEFKTALLVLLSVLIVFYLLGMLFVKVILSFDRVNEERRKEQVEQEGLVLEKDALSEETENVGE